MKAKIKSQNEYHPVEIAITLETQEEFDNFYLITNTSPIVDATIGSKSAKIIRDTLDESGQRDSRTRQTSTIVNEMIAHPSVQSILGRI